MSSNGPKLDLLDTHEPESTAARRLLMFEKLCRASAKRNRLDLVFRQSDIEGKSYVNWIQEASKKKAAGIILNAAGPTNDVGRCLGRPIGDQAARRSRFTLRIFTLANLPPRFPDLFRWRDRPSYTGSGVQGTISRLPGLRPDWAARRSTDIGESTSNTGKSRWSTTMSFAAQSSSWMETGLTRGSKMNRQASVSRRPQCRPSGSPGTHITPPAQQHQRRSQYRRPHQPTPRQACRHRHLSDGRHGLYRARARARRLIEVGTKVKAGQTLLIIEAMKTMNQIPAPRSGTVNADPCRGRPAGGIRRADHDHRVGELRCSTRS